MSAAALELFRDFNDINHADQRPPLFLGQLEGCLFTDNTGDYLRPMHGPNLSIDHLVPGLAARQHPRLLRGIHKLQENQVRLCNGDGSRRRNGCHQLRDHHPTFGKLRLYREFGLPGLVQDLAAYPRATKPKLYCLQYHQWRELFGLLASSLDKVIKEDKVPKPSQRQYTSSRDIIAYHLYQWENYNFDVRFPALDLLT